jgi:hypothetical protein
MDMQDSRNFGTLLGEIISQNLQGFTAPAAQRIGTISIENGLRFPQAITGARPTAGEPVPPPAKVVDGLGHSRPIYRALLVYAWLRATELGGWMTERAANKFHEGHLPRWCELIERGATLADGPVKGVETLNALTLYVAGKQLKNAAWQSHAASAFERLPGQQQSNGSLLPPMAGSSPEARWYDELVLLHAMCTYSVQTGDPVCASAVRRAAEYHLMETQPDHATQQPWAIFAFLSTPTTAIGAEQILQGCVMQNAKRLDAVSLILLADALWCISASLGNSG